MPASWLRANRGLIATGGVEISREAWPPIACKRRGKTGARKVGTFGSPSGGPGAPPPAGHLSLDLTRSKRVPGLAARILKLSLSTTSIPMAAARPAASSSLASVLRCPAYITPWLM